MSAAAPQRPTAGPHHPLPATPEQAPRSARRTTTTDVLRPDGPAGPAEGVELRGRDRRLDAAGQVTEAAELVLRLTIDPLTSELVAIDGEPGQVVDGLDALVGTPVRSGFGRRLAAQLGPELDRRTLRASILEDLPGAFLVSGYSTLRAGAISATLETAGQFADHQADICIGWARGSQMHTVLAEHAHVAVPLGPAAPPLDTGGAWHPAPEPAEGTVRRRRRLDVVRDEANDRLLVDSHLRDSYRAADGDPIEEMALHEYVVAAVVDGAGRLVDITVDPRTLPWAECPGAAASASQLVGASLDQVAMRARTELVGPTTCTHLTSTLRALADVAALR